MGRNGLDLNAAWILGALFREYTGYNDRSYAGGTDSSVSKD